MSRCLRVALLLWGGCHRDLYRPCDDPDDCEVPDGRDAECLDNSGRGFCTWSCGTDEDCDDGGDEDMVCASFESEGALHCFPACEEGEDDEDACPRDFTCRSTGGGSDNRKVCFPEG